MRKYFEVLRGCQLFQNIADENLLAILGCIGAQVKKYKKDQVVLSEGEPVTRFGIVLSGRIQIIRNDYYGNRSIVTGVESSELFGESFACAGIQGMPVDVVAAEDTEVMLVDAGRITSPCSSACEFHSQMIYNLVNIMARKNLQFHQRIEITSKRTTREKLMAYLLLQAKQNGSDSFTIPFDRQELADYLEVDRSGLSAEISKLRKEGILESRRNQFRLL